MRTARKTTPQILLVDDSEDDFLLAQEGFSEAGVNADLHYVENGRDCMDFLRRVGRLAGAPQADMVLLDLNMPQMGGREVLGEMLLDPKRMHLVSALVTDRIKRECAELEKDGRAPAEHHPIFLYWRGVGRFLRTQTFSARPSIHCIAR